MHLSSKELRVAYAIYGGPTTEREKWVEEALGRPRTVVYSDERSAEAEGASCITCGRARRAAELHSEVGWYAQYLADRALWSAAEPVPWPDTSGEPSKAWLARDVSED